MLPAEIFYAFHELAETQRNDHNFYLQERERFYFLLYCTVLLQNTISGGDRVL